MMKKEDFHEDQLVVAVKDSGERKSQSLYTVLEVHDSHLVVMSPWHGLDAVFYDNPRTTYSPATRGEIIRVREDLMQYRERIQKDLDDTNKRLSVMAESLSKLDHEANR